VSEAPTAFEAWNDYDPSMRFITAFPITAAQGTESSTVAYYEFEPGRHSGLHADNAEEVIYVADGEGEIFISGRQERLEAGGFVFVKEGVQHDIYAYGEGPLRLLSFFPTNRVESTFTETLLPFGGHVVTSETTGPPQLEELSFDDLPPELAESLGFHGQPVVVTGDQLEQTPLDPDVLEYWGLTDRSAEGEGGEGAAEGAEAESEPGTEAVGAEAEAEAAAAASEAADEGEAPADDDGGKDATA
jgi:quercetin dioxygenase-like cupin family protein